MEERKEIIKQLREFHPGDIQLRDKRAAWYVGGMRDTGDLNYRWLYEEATIKELKELIENLSNNTWMSNSWD